MRSFKNFRHRFNIAMDAGLGIILIKLVFALIIIGVVTNVIPEFARGLLPAQDGKAGVETWVRNPLPVPA